VIQLLSASVFNTVVVLSHALYLTKCSISHAFSSHTHTHPFNGPFSGNTQVSRYQKGKTNLDFTEARDSELQWHELDHMQVCTSLQADNHASTPPLSFLQAGCPSCRPTNSVKALKPRVVKIKVYLCSAVVKKVTVCCNFCAANKCAFRCCLNC